MSFRLNWLMALFHPFYFITPSEGSSGNRETYGVRWKQKIEESTLLSGRTGTPPPLLIRNLTRPRAPVLCTRPQTWFTDLEALGILSFWKGRYNMELQIMRQPMCVLGRALALTGLVQRKDLQVGFPKFV